MLDDDRDFGAEVLGALPIFPLPNAVLLPGVVLPLNVFEPRYLDLVDHALDHGRHVGVPLLRPGYEHDYSGSPDVEPVFGIGKLLTHRVLPDGRRFIRLEGVRRVRARFELAGRARFRKFSVDLLPEDPAGDDLQLEVLKAQIERISRTLGGDEQQLVHSVLEIPDKRVLVYAIAAIMPTFGCLPTHARNGRSPVIDLQQRCLDAETTDRRIGLLIESSATICGELSESGRFPRTMLN